MILSEDVVEAATDPGCCWSFRYTDWPACSSVAVRKFVFNPSRLHLMPSASRRAAITQASVRKHLLGGGRGGGGSGLLPASHFYRFSPNLF